MGSFKVVSQDCFRNRSKYLPICLFLKDSKIVSLFPVLTWKIVTYIKFPSAFKNGNFSLTE